MGGPVVRRRGVVMRSVSAVVVAVMTGVAAFLVAGSAPVVALSYDAAGQLTGRTDSAGADDTYTYGPRGLRLSAVRNGPNTTSYTYNDAAQLTGFTAPGVTASFSYDADGRRTSFGYGGLLASSTTYDARGLPVQVDAAGPAIPDRASERRYDTDRGLVEHATTPTGGPTSTTALVWDATRPAGAPAITRTDSDTFRANQGSDLVGFTGEAGETIELTVDHQRNVLASPGVPDAPVGHDAFGVNGRFDAVVAVGYRSEAAYDWLLHLRNRDYDPSHAVFTTRDPLDGIPGTPTETNPYHDADNDPVNKTDPLGLSPDDSDDGFEPPIDPGSVCDALELATGGRRIYAGRQASSPDVYVRTTSGRSATINWDAPLPSAKPPPSAPTRSSTSATPSTKATDPRPQAPTAAAAAPQGRAVEDQHAYPPPSHHRNVTPRTRQAGAGPRPSTCTQWDVRVGRRSHAAPTLSLMVTMSARALPMSWGTLGACRPTRARRISPRRSRARCGCFRPGHRCPISQSSPTPAIT